MSKETSSFSLIIFLFIILTAWWAVSSFKIPQRPPAVTIQVPLPDVAHTKPPLQVAHSFIKGVHSYTGSMNISSCDNFLTGVSVTAGTASHVQLTFNIFPGKSSCYPLSSLVSEPFAVSFSANKFTNKPVLDSVFINNAAAAFLVTEATLK